MATRGGGGRNAAAAPSLPAQANQAVDSFGSKISNFWFQYVEFPFIQLGLGNPNVRFLVVTLATAGLLWWLKPPAFFHPKTGKARPSVIRAGLVQDAVVLDWVLFSIFLGAVTVLFI